MGLAWENTLRYIEDLKGVKELAKRNALELASKLRISPEEARIRIGPRNYILLSVESLAGLAERASAILGGATAKEVLYYLGESLGRAEAGFVFSTYGLEDEVMQCWERCLHAPYFLAAGGVARVEILLFDAEMKEGLLALCETRDSVLAEELARAGVEPPTCSLISGYLAGWLGEATGAKLAAREILCRASGDPVCRFVVGKPKRLYELLKREDLRKPSEDYGEVKLEFEW